jgi:hypothetical protein
MKAKDLIILKNEPAGQGSEQPYRLGVVIETPVGGDATVLRYQELGPAVTAGTTWTVGTDRVVAVVPSA